MSKDFSEMLQFLRTQSVLTIATAEIRGSWSTPLLYVADTVSDKVSLYFLSSANSRHIQSLPSHRHAAASVYSDYNGHWQSIRGVQMEAIITEVDSQEQKRVEALYFNRFPEVETLINAPLSEQERQIGIAFSKSIFYCMSPSFIRFTNNTNQFAGRSEWRL